MHRYILACTFMIGAQVARDEAQALVYFKKAAGGGHADAQFNCGVMTSSGAAGNSRDDASAFKYFKLAAAQGHAKAQCNLAAMCAHLHPHCIFVTLCTCTSPTVFL